MKRKQLQRTGPQVFAPSQSSGFQVFILCADVCLHPLIPARSGFCLFQLSLLCFGFVSYVLRQDIAFIAKKQFVFFACIFGRRSNGLKFRRRLASCSNSEMWIGLRWQQPAKLRAGFGGLKTARKHCHGQGASTVPEYPLQTLVK